MDIATIKAQTSTFQPYNPATGETFGLEMEIVSLNDERIEAVRNRQREEADDYARRRISMPADVVKRRTNELFSACVVSWTWGGDATYHGKKPKCTDAEKTAVLTELPWLMNQLIDALMQEQRFFTKNAAISSTT